MHCDWDEHEVHFTAFPSATPPSFSFPMPTTFLNCTRVNQALYLHLSTDQTATDMPASDVGGGGGYQGGEGVVNSVWWWLLQTIINEIWQCVRTVCRVCSMSLSNGQGGCGEGEEGEGGGGKK